MAEATDHRWGFLRALLIIRLINSLWVTTFFQPDEYFQALEPAWDLAFGPNSGAWITWEWHHQLRSVLHPAIFSVPYYVSHHVSRILPLSQALKMTLVVNSPRVLQGVFAALGDWYTWRLAVKVYPEDNNKSSFALFLTILSAWQWYCSVRTFSNSLETTLTVMALYYFPLNQLLGEVITEKENTRGPVPLRNNPRTLRLAIIFASFAFFLRPTNILIWIPIFGLTVTRLGLKGASPITRDNLFIICREIVLCGLLVMDVCVVSDYQYYGFWTFPSFNFLYFNISKGLAVLYGRNPWHYYLVQGLPLLCTVSLPAVLYGLYKPAASSTTQRNVLFTLSCSVFLTIGALSVISHKEVRFIYPLLPILNVLAAPYVSSFFTTRATPSSTPKIRRTPYLYAALAINVLIAGFLSILHQPAPIGVLAALRTEFANLPPPPPGSSDDGAPPLFALFLMPCHSTPWRSHLVHPNLHAYALSCEPPLHTNPNTPERDSYRDEADRFYDDPVGFLSNELFADVNPTLPALPRYIVGFEGVEPLVRKFTEESPQGRRLEMQLTPVWSGFNGFFNEDPRRAGRIVVWDTGIRNSAVETNNAPEVAE